MLFLDRMGTYKLGGGGEGTRHSKAAIQHGSDITGVQ